MRTYSVYLEGGAAFNIKAARFEATPEGVRFYGEDDQPLPDTYIDPKTVIAVLPPSAGASSGGAGFLPA